MKTLPITFGRAELQKRVRKHVREAFRPIERTAPEGQDAAVGHNPQSRESRSCGEAACSPANKSGADRRAASIALNRIKRTPAFAAVCWAEWRRCEDWPGYLDMFEAAAYLRIAYTTVWRACQLGSDGKAQLRHQRIGPCYRIARADLDTFGAVPGGGAGALTS